jgi:hypothetical protein
MAEIDDAELQALRDKAASADALQAKASEAEAATAALAQAQADAHTATEAARAAMIIANPHIPADLIQGETIQAIEASLAAATAIANRLAEAAATAPKAPLGFVTGGTQRLATAAPEGIRGIERIRFGLANRSV